MPRMCSLEITDCELERFNLLYGGYKRLYNDPCKAMPMVIVNVPINNIPTWYEQLRDPLAMLDTQLRHIKPHLEIGDDYVPTVRVNFGTGQVAAAFGAELIMPSDSLPAVGSPILNNIEDAYKLSRPNLQAGWYGKLKQWTQIWLENLPQGINIQHPDIQSPFNTAHLLCGNDILTDFYDNPNAVETLLDVITDYMIELVPYLKNMISSDPTWFFDWGAMWKGTARISNCSTTMISPEFYKKHIFPRDARFINSVGGGRIHYCGNAHSIIKEFFTLSSLTGLDCDCQYHDLWELAHNAPPRVTLIFQQYGSAFPFTDRLLKGDWPKKRNIIVITEAPNVEEGKKLFCALKNSIPYS